MDALTRAALKARGVRKVVVSNNNPDHRIRDHVDVDDPRVRLIDQPTRFGCGNRYDIARDDDAEHFLCIDDDIFLRPGQIDGLIDKLRDDPAVPHGLHGSEYLPGSGTDRPTTLYYRGQDIDVDVLHNIYAFTRTHVRYYFANLELGRRHGLEHLEICDDILLSHAAPSRPLIHDLGRYSVDPTWNADDVAVFRQPEYERSRDRAMEFFILRSLERALPAQAG